MCIPVLRDEGETNLDKNFNYFLPHGSRVYVQLKFCVTTMDTVEVTDVLGFPVCN